MNGHMTARTLRIVLIALLVLLIAGGYGLFTLGHNYLNDQAQLTSDAATKAEASKQEQSNLANTKIELEKNQQAVERAAKITANSKNYAYQDQITNDISRIAKQTGVTITSISFDEASGSTSGATPAPATPAPGATAAASGLTAAPVTGVKSTSATITLKSPVPYNQIVNFIYAVEQNLTKMRVGGIALSADQASRGDVSSGAITIEVYLQQ